jgi:hypothetical protein
LVGAPSEQQYFSGAATGSEGRREKVATQKDRRYTVGMSITATVEKDTIKLPDGIHVPDGTRVRLEIATAGANQWPADYFERTAGALASEPLERPAQGDAPLREAC